MVASLRGRAGTGTKEDESSTGRVWAAGFHHFRARSRLASVFKHMNRLFLSFSNFFFGPQLTAVIESACTTVHLYSHLHVGFPFGVVSSVLPRKFVDISQFLWLPYAPPCLSDVNTALKILGGEYNSLSGFILPVFVPHQFDLERPHSDTYQVPYPCTR